MPCREDIPILARVDNPQIGLRHSEQSLRHPDDRPTIGLVLCRSKSKIIVEYALLDVKKPIGVAAWETRIVKSLP